MSKIKVLMFGWEFPPFSSGGLGTACHGLTKGLVRVGVDVTFVLPKVPENTLYSNKGGKNFKILSPEHYKGIEKHEGKIKFIEVNSLLKPYISSKEYDEKFGLERFKEEGGYEFYGKDLFSEVLRYAKEARKIAEVEDFDVIHCHDWLTCLSGIEAKKVALRKEKNKGKNIPLIFHVHATEFDRTIGNPNKFVYNIEQKGIKEADYVITVSDYTRNMLIKNYNADPKKILVIHNSIDPPSEKFCKEKKETTLLENKFKKNYKIVLFLGRITIQKGPDHFLWIAKKILEKRKDVRFLIVGSGDMQPYVIEEAANLGIGDKVLFEDFLHGEKVEKAYKLADVFVMPSISEPFGLTALEAVKNGTPAVISKQSGVSEVLKNCLIADFWDINEMANKIIALLDYNPLRDVLIEEGLKEIKENFTWEKPARKCLELYKRAIFS